MTIGLHSYYDIFNQEDNLFRPEAYPIGDGLEKPFVAFRDLARLHGHEVVAFDRESADSCDLLIFLDYPEHRRDLIDRMSAAGKRCFLVILESEIILPGSWDPKNYSPFRRVFSWNPVHNRLYHCSDLPLAQNLEPLPSVPAMKDREFACLVAGNKTSNDPRELYSTRRRIIRWYERHAPDSFDLFGLGWDKRDYVFSRRLRKYCPPLGMVQTKPFPSYRGSVKAKRETLSHYQFNFCLENVRDIPGYLTEKLFDALAAGCIPVYWGDKGAGDSVPADCWIDCSSFTSIRELNQYLKQLSREEKQEYQNRGRQFLLSTRAELFSANHFAATLLNAAEGPNV